MGLYLADKSNSRSYQASCRASHMLRRWRILRRISGLKSAESTVVDLATLRLAC